MPQPAEREAKENAARWLAQLDLPLVMRAVAVQSLADLLLAARDEEAEACAKVCAEWADRQLESARVKLEEDGLPGSAAEHECAAAIGRMMAESIRSRIGTKEGR